MNKLTNILGAGLMAAVTGVVAAAQENLTAETAQPGGAPHLAISHLAEAAAASNAASLQVQSGQTLTNTILNVAEGKTDVGVAGLILALLLEKGRGPFAAQGEDGAALAGELRALYPYNLGVYALFAFDTAGIDSYADLEGRNVLNGPPRGGALVQARQIIQIVSGLKDGEGYTGVQANWGQMGVKMIDGSSDASLLPNTFPDGRVVTAQSAGRVTLVSMPKDQWETGELRKFATGPGNTPFILPISEMGYGDGVTIVSEDDMFRGVGIAGAEIVNASMSFETAKALTAAHIATMDELKAKAPWAKNINFGVLDAETSGFCGAISLKYHPGAVAAWEEAGYAVPGCAKP